MATRGKRPATSADYAAFRRKYGCAPIDMGVGMARDADGVYVHTHRARSQSYPSADRIPKRVIRYIESTG